VIYEWKIVVWDIVMGWGTTDPIKGQVADWATAVIWSIFGSAAGIHVAAIVAGRKAS
jgi:hypothetical protein